jgi:tRNA (guanine-N7-)-methyltransferase
MARRNKLSKFSEVLNVVENYDPKVPVLTFSPEEDVDLKGKWKSHFFKNDSLLIVELACGRGEYSLALGQANPTKNYLGVDIKGARIWKGAKAAIDEGLDNVKFLRCKIELIKKIGGLLRTPF